MARIIDARVRQKAATLEEWNNSDLDSLDGEQLFVRSDVDDKVIGFKLGAKGKKFSDLDYPDFTVRGKVSPTSTWAGRQSGVYIPTSSGVYNGVTVNLTEGYQVLYWDGNTIEKVVYPADYTSAVFGGVIDETKDLSTPPSEPTWYIASPGDYNTTPAITLTENSILTWDGNEWSHIPFELEVRGEFLVADNIAELRNITPEVAQLLVNETYKGVEVLGYYEKGDTPAPIIYYLSDTTEEDDGGSVFEVGGIKLEHDFDDEVDLIYYGVNEDIEDSSIIINKVLRLFENSSKKVINTKNLRVISKNNDRFSGCIELVSGVSFINKGTISLSPTTNSSYAIIAAVNKQDFNIEVGNVIGYKGSLLSSGEWGMGVSINQCKNFYISKGVIKDCWGDGMYISGVIANNSDNFNIHDIQCYYNRRQGLSIVGAKNGFVYNCSFNDTKGAAPQSGVDIEPNGGQEVRNVTFNNIICEGNEVTGFQIYSQFGDVEDITVNNLQCIGNKQEGVLLRHPKNKNIVFNNTIIKDSPMGVECRQGYEDAFFKNIQFFNISNTGIYLRQDSKNVHLNNVFIKDVERAVSLNAIENVTISDAVVYNSKIESNNSSNVLLNNIKGFNISSENFINIFSGSYITIKNSDVQGNEDYSMKRGVYFSSAGTKRFISVVNVTVTNSNTHGVEFISVDTGDISSCIFYKCRGAALIKLGTGSKNVTVQNCIGKTTLLTEDKVFAGIDCSTGLEKLSIQGNDFKNTYSGTAEVSGFGTAIDSILIRDIASNQLGSVRQSLAVSDVVSPNATDLATTITLINELKAKLNAKLAADRASGQQSTT